MESLLQFPMEVTHKHPLKMNKDNRDSQILWYREVNQYLLIEY